MRDYIPSLVSQKENSSLAVLSFDEVKIIVFSMDSANSRGLDGFTVYFFQKCWDILDHDIVAAVTDFFRIRRSC